ncbi:hypothetical protein AB0K89_08730 [Streptomyces cinnamoneus]|uniref:hypothetical protein n=1 Tax=Streptomyces cinnamoneus TaxID=53446 RepID=UPI0034450034
MSWPGTSGSLNCGGGTDPANQAARLRGVGCRRLHRHHELLALGDEVTWGITWSTAESRWPGDETVTDLKILTARRIDLVADRTPASFQAWSARWT